MPASPSQFLHRHTPHALTGPDVVGLYVIHTLDRTLPSIDVIQPRTVILQTALADVAPISPRFAFLGRIRDNLLCILKLRLLSSFQHLDLNSVSPLGLERILIPLLSS